MGRLRPRGVDVDAQAARGQRYGAAETHQERIAFAGSFGQLEDAILDDACEACPVEYCPAAAQLRRHGERLLLVLRQRPVDVDPGERALQDRGSCGAMQVRDEFVNRIAVAAKLDIAGRCSRKARGGERVAEKRRGIELFELDLSAQARGLVIDKHAHSGLHRAAVGAGGR